MGFFMCTSKSFILMFLCSMKCRRGTPPHTLIIIPFTASVTFSIAARLRASLRAGFLPLFLFCTAPALTMHGKKRLCTKCGVGHFGTRTAPELRLTDYVRISRPRCAKMRQNERITAFQRRIF